MTGYIRSMRPETWPLASIPTLFSGLMASGFDLSAAGLVLLAQPIAILCIVVLGAINMFNEVYDTSQDKVNKPTRPIVSGKLRASSARNASFLLFVVALVWSLAVDPMLFAMTAALIVLGIAYSLPELRLKDNAITAMLALGLGYGVIMPLSPWLLFTGSSAWVGALIAIMGFVWFAGTTNFKDFKDRPGDEASKIPTFVVVRGERFTLRLMMLMMVFIPASLLAVYVALRLLPVMALLAGVDLALTLCVLASLYHDYSPEKAFTGYKITYFLYPLFFMLLAVGFLGSQ